MKIKVLPIPPIEENACIIYENGKALIVDPGDINGEVIDFLKENNIEPLAILLTHGHFDHVLGVEKIVEEYNIPIYGSISEKEIFENPDFNLSKKHGCDLSIHCNYFFNEEEISIGDFTFTTILTNGHTPGSSCFYFAEDKVLFAGDTLFQGSIGRTDFYMGDHSAIIENIKKKLFILPDDTKVFTGHGASTSIGNEKRNNPFF